MEAICSTESVSLMAKFNLSDVKPHLPYHVAFLINVFHGGKTIGRTVIDKGASTCVMSISCWKTLGSPQLVPFNTLLTAFNRRHFCSHGILPSFDIKLEGKTLSVEIEVVNSPLDYNLLLGRSWTYVMCAIP